MSSFSFFFLLANVTLVPSGITLPVPYTASKPDVNPANNVLPALAKNFPNFFPLPSPSSAADPAAEIPASSLPPPVTPDPETAPPLSFLSF